MKYKSVITYGLLIALTSFIMISCSKMDDSIDAFAKDGEINYSTRVNTVTSFGGKERVKVVWTLPPNRTATKAIIYWNDKTESKEVPVNSTDSNFEIVLDNMTEGTYLFSIFTHDNAGNRSVGSIFSGASYGSIYQSGLYNRGVASSELNGESALSIRWNGAATGEIGTKLTYIDTSGATQVLTVLPSENTTIVNHVMAGAKVSIQSSYLPEPGAIDVFEVEKADELSITM